MRAFVVSLLLVAIPFFEGGCRQASTEGPQFSKASESQPLPEITSESEEGYYDLVFAIEDYKKLPDGSQAILASGMYKGRKVSLGVYVSTGSVIYRSVGAESDLLLKALDEIYGTKQAPQTMKKTTEFTAISLEGDAGDLAKGPVKMKLFFESNVEDDYAELYTNIDLKTRKLYITEKDEWYRAAIVRALRVP